jgi:hypothetical protein
MVFLGVWLWERGFVFMQSSMAVPVGIIDKIQTLSGLRPDLFRRTIRQLFLRFNKEKTAA